jgi:hypothetical protein
MRMRPRQSIHMHKNTPHVSNSGRDSKSTRMRSICGGGINLNATLRRDNSRHPSSANADSIHPIVRIDQMT